MPGASRGAGRRSPTWRSSVVPRWATSWWSTCRRATSAWARAALTSSTSTSPAVSTAKKTGSRPLHRDPNVMKLNYTSLQHTVEPVEELGSASEHPIGVSGAAGRRARPARPARGGRLGLLAGLPGSRLGYVQTAGGALPGGHSRTVRSLRERGLLAGHLTAGAAFGGEGEAITTIGALDHGLRGTRLGRGDLRARPRDRGLQLPARARRHVRAGLRARRARARRSTLLVARMSSGDPRARHRGISHHTLTVLDLLLEPVTVALPAGMRSPVGADLRAGLGAVFGGALPSRPALELDVERPRASPATTGAVRSSIFRPTPPPVCPPRRWAVG